MQEATIVERLRSILLRVPLPGSLLFSTEVIHPAASEAASLIERQQQVIDLLMKAVEPFAEVAASDRISQLSDDDLADDVDFCLPAIAFRRAREAKVEAERILNHSHP